MMTPETEDMTDLRSKYVELEERNKNLSRELDNERSKLNLIKEDTKNLKFENENFNSEKSELLKQVQKSSHVNLVKCKKGIYTEKRHKEA